MIMTALGRMWLLDYTTRTQELEQSSNPFSIIVHAFLKTRETVKAPEERLQWKITFSKMLYLYGFSKEDILELIRFLNWIMVLPEDLEQRFQEALYEFEEEQHMHYTQQRHNLRFSNPSFAPLAF